MSTDLKFGAYLYIDLFSPTLVEGRNEKITNGKRKKHIGAMKNHVLSADFFNSY